MIGLITAMTHCQRALLERLALCWLGAGHARRRCCIVLIVLPRCTVWKLSSLQTVHSRRDYSHADTMTAIPIISIRSITKRFPGVVALEDVSLDVAAPANCTRSAAKTARAKAR